MTLSLRITEIFFSIQGESTTVGLPTVFVRLTGCPLRCVYCDSAYAFKGGEKLTLEDITQKVKSFGAQYITVTGGEPLAQPGCITLLSTLCDLGYQVSLETSGALPIDKVDKRVMIVMDLKSPSSGESHRNLFENLNHLKPTDQLKLIIANRNDYEWAKELIQDKHLTQYADVLLSPSWEELPIKELAEWILQDKLQVRLQTQLHKYIWGDVPGV